MTIHLGNVPAGSTLYIPFATYDANGASITMSGFAVGDILIYKNGSITQRASTAGFTLLDTDGTDFDAITGLQGFSIDLSDNTTAGFYSVGGFYWVVVSTVTVNTQVVTLVAATFRIVVAENTLGTPVTEPSKLAGDVPSPMQFLRYNYANEIYVPVGKAGSPDFAVSADWTPAPGDVKVTKDGGASANIGTLPTAIVMGNGAVWKFVLTAAELKSKKLVVTVVDGAPKAVRDLSIPIITYGHPLSGLAFIGALQIGTAPAATNNSITLQDPTGDIAVDPSGMPFAVLATTTGMESRLADSFNVGTQVATMVEPFANTPAGAEITYALGSFGASVSADPADQADIDLITAAIADVPRLVWEYMIDGTYKAIEYMRGIGAAVFGKSSSGGGHRKYRNPADTKDVIDASVSAGDRTTVTKDFT
jgi:hypothetical protein